MSNRAAQQAVGAALRAMRKARGLSIYDAGDALGTTAMSVSRLERAETPMTVDTLNSFAALYGTTPDEVLAANSKELRAAVPKDITRKARQLEADINRRHFGVQEE